MSGTKGEKVVAHHDDKPLQKSIGYFRHVYLCMTGSYNIQFCRPLFYI